MANTLRKKSLWSTDSKGGSWESIGILPCILLYSNYIQMVHIIRFDGKYPWIDGSKCLCRSWKTSVFARIWCYFPWKKLKKIWNETLNVVLLIDRFNNNSFVIIICFCFFLIRFWNKSSLIELLCVIVCLFWVSLLVFFDNKYVFCYIIFFW